MVQTSARAVVNVSTASDFVSPSAIKPRKIVSPSIVPNYSRSDVTSLVDQAMKK